MPSSPCGCGPRQAGGRCRVTGQKLVIEVPVVSAARALVAMGRRELPLVGQGEGRVVVDRPRGVPSMRTIEEEEERRKSET